MNKMSTYCRQAGWCMFCAIGALAAMVGTASCDNEIDGNYDIENPITFYFDGDDLYHEIPAEGGNLSLFPEGTKNLKGDDGYVINQPLSWFLQFRAGDADYIQNDNLFYRDSHHLFYERNDITESINPKEVRIYYFENGYTHDSGYHYAFENAIDLYYNNGRYYEGIADWLEIHIYEDHTELIAQPNDSGKDRYFSFIYDHSGYPYSYYGSVEVKQPAR